MIIVTCAIIALAFFGAGYGTAWLVRDRREDQIIREFTNSINATTASAEAVLGVLGD